jgi:NADH dehydrogenase
VYGREDVALNRFVGFARRLPFVPMFGDGKQLMQPVFVNDLANLVASAVDKAEATGLTFEVGGPEVLSMNAVIEIALNVAGMRKPVLHQPVFVGKLLGSFLQFLPGPPLTRDAIDFITHEATADNSAMQRVFAPQLTTLEEGLRSYLSGRKALNVGA